MVDLVTPTTKLEAVNWALKALGLRQVGTIEGVIGGDASIVLSALDDEARNLCRRGMWFARRDLTLTPDSNGYLVLPSNVLSVRPPSDRMTVNLAMARVAFREDRSVMRQGKVFSVYRQSYVYTQPFTIGIHEALPFEDLPDEARSYVQVYSALETNGSIVRSEDVTKKLAPLLNSTWNALVDADLENMDYRFK